MMPDWAIFGLSAPKPGSVAAGIGLARIASTTTNTVTASNTGSA